jgi:hypothetical protein
MLISIFDTSITDNNLGNEIIMDAVYKQLRSIFGTYFFIKLPYLDSIGGQSIEYIKHSDHVFLGGTNALTAEMETYRQWGIDKQNYSNIKKVILMGVGWWQYQGRISKYTSKILRHVLHKDLLHSVRDSYTETKLKEIGITNTINTSCPTMWELTENHCSSIPERKSDSVLITLTNYSQDFKNDAMLLKIIEKNYSKIYAWIQGPEDFAYIKKINDKVIILPPSLEALDKLLASPIAIDYIGTRLHAGIRALQFKRRSIIIAVDNRALEKQKDFNLVVIERNNLDHLQETITGSFKTKINLPVDNINRWKNQFEVYSYV